jgi:large subunit ribosomal protein L23
MNDSLYTVFKKPIITEKSTMLSKLGHYTFEVVKGVNKIELAKAFESVFPGRKVTAVRLIKVPAKAKRVGKKKGVTSSKLKAIFCVQGEAPEYFSGV